MQRAVLVRQSVAAIGCANVKINISGGKVTAKGGRCAIGTGAGGKYSNEFACPTYLSWNDKSKDSMSFTVDSEIDKLSLNSPFKDIADGTIFPTNFQFGGQVKLAGRTLVPASGYHTVTFNSNYGSKVPSQTVADGDCAQKPDNLTLKGYRFVGWRLVTNGKMASTNLTSQRRSPPIRSSRHSGSTRRSTTASPSRLRRRTAPR